jgi:hypothetical protein
LFISIQNQAVGFSCFALRVNLAPLSSFLQAHWLSNVAALTVSPQKSQVCEENLFYEGLSKHLAFGACIFSSLLQTLRQA